MGLNVNVRFEIDAEEIRRMVAEAILHQYGVEIFPERVTIKYSRDYDFVEFSGVTIDLDLEESRKFDQRKEHDPWKSS